MPDTVPVPTVAMAGTDQVMDVSYAIQALAPLMHMHTLDFAGTGHDTYVHTGLQALAYLRNRSALIWPALWSLGLKAELLELVYRLHLSMAYQTRPEYHQAILLINTQRILVLAPNNVFNARAVCINPFIDLSTKYDVVLATTKAAKRNNDDVAMSVLLWELCQILLLGGGGPTFKKSIIDHIVHHGITYTTHSCSWGGHFIMGHRREVMWRCVGAAEGLKAQSEGDVFSAFTSEEHLQSQVIHVTCDACMQLTRPSKISRCQACLQVKYCSTECQIFHWMRVHSTECPAGNTLPIIEDLQQK
ncbi:hypothetical protein COCSUDRAFT_45511 [Coccomyxa subellipsoidea C-169]|uniref:MYND-type domain-containing protein n=1 Tax=Coccomyxa subellipsoidea (strain C-169) TaxID=574566 RepID=I0YIN2_COCSC|nr:hypothetical protein COCSUDRAFT_45511 [Coccomyxa subellipsoidea C-169]EIE18251.1 hypothetical protein COCSUDRAFT_45511 [Coccomyxa subellipsoidea C-169]|eukprot:XP_005642795.1 hypothetical protein COCSUDRAFT_45511 [Coccomyxa subellipsoidea C-169]